MAILTPIAGTPEQGSTNWGPTTKEYFNKFTATGTLMSEVHSSVLDVLINDAVERPNPSVIASSGINASIVLVDEYGKSTIAEPGNHFISPHVNTTIDNGAQINLGTNAYYIKDTGDVSFKHLNVSTEITTSALNASYVSTSVITVPQDSTNERNLTIVGDSTNIQGDLTVEQTVSTTTFSGSTFSGGNFSGVNFQGEKFTGDEFFGGSFSGTTFSGTEGTFSEQITIIDSTAEPVVTTTVTPTTISTSIVNTNTINGVNGTFSSQVVVADSTNATTINPTLVSTTTISGTVLKGTTFSGSTFSGGTFSGTTIDGTVGTFTDQITVVDASTSTSTTITPTTINTSTINGVAGNISSISTGTINGSNEGGIVIIKNSDNVSDSLTVGNGNSPITLSNNVITASTGNFKNLTITDGITLPTTTGVQILNASTRVSTPLVSATTVTTSNLTATSTVTAASVRASSGNFDTFYLNGRAFTSTILTTLSVSTAEPTKDGTYSLWVNSTANNQVLNYLSVSTNASNNSWVPLGAVFK